MPLKMTTMFKKFIITSQISNYILKESVFMADFFNLIYSYKKYNIQPIILIIKIPAPEK
ncbi:hypothetical protein HmCmsJML069_03537 [Escherichia coli]|nr:hypothetical protein HmCmsJML069_03537 [Escherichia coli]